MHKNNRNNLGIQLTDNYGQILFSESVYHPVIVYVNFWVEYVRGSNPMHIIAFYALNDNRQNSRKQYLGINFRPQFLLEYMRDNHKYPKVHFVKLYKIYFELT